MPYNAWTNTDLQQGRLTRIFGDSMFARVVIKPDPNGFVNWKSLRREIFKRLNALGWERFIIKSVKVSDSGNTLILNLEASQLKDETEAWAMYLGDVITLPPEY